MSITSYQFILIIYGTQVGIDVLSIPRELAEKAGSSGWIALVIGGSLSTLLSCIYVKLREKSPNTNIPDYFQYYLGAFLGRIISFILVIYLMFLGYWTLIRACLYIRSYILEEVSMVILLILLFIPTYQLVTGGIHLIAKYMEAIFPIILLFFVSQLGVLERAHYEYLLPIIKEGWMPIVKTVHTSFFPYHGFGMIIAVYPYLKEKEKAMKGVIIANALSTGVYLFATLICFVFYSPNEIQRVFLPVLEMLSVIEFQFVERVDFIIFCLYLIVVSKTWSIYLWTSVNTFMNLFPRSRLKLLMVFVFGIILVYTYVFEPTYALSDQQSKVTGNVGLSLITVLPLLLWLGRKIQKR